MSRRPRRIFAAAASATLLASCSGVVSRPVPPVMPVPPAAERRLLGYSFEGRPIHAIVLGAGSDTSMLLGSIHGDEPIGGPLLERFADHLEGSPSALRGRRVVLIPTPNPDGLVRRQRPNARGVDLNRNFPAADFRPSRAHGPNPASEIETQLVLAMIEAFRPVRILAVHAARRCVNYDGPALELATAIARSAGYALQASIGYATPGSLGSYGRDRSLAVITLEASAADGAAGKELERALEVFVTFAAARSD